MNVKVRWLQGRRIRCAHCKEAFVYLHEGTETFETYGVSLVSSDEGMQKEISKQARKRFAKKIQKTKVGRGLCPGCRRYQSWMVWESRANSVIAWGLGAMGVSVVFGIFLIVMPPWAQEPGFRLGTVAVLLGTGIVVGWRRAIPAGVVPKRVDPFSITDEEFRGLLDHSRRADADPLTEWYFSARESAPGNAVLLSVGCKDYTGEEFFPPKWSSETVMGSL